MEPTQTTDAVVLNGENGGLPYGSIAHKLMSNGLNVNALRTNDVLRKEEWLLFDRTVVEVARPLLIGVGDLMSRGLVMPITDALGTTVIQWENVSDMTDASTDMSGIAPAERDRLKFSTVQMPLPITHKDFHLSLRNLHSGRRMGTPLDTAMASTATRKVAEALESMLFKGVSITSGGGTIYGYTNHPNRNTGTTDAWHTPGTAGTLIVADVLEMIGALQADNMFGPYQIYCSVPAYVNLLDDFKANSDKATINRILEIPGILGVKGTTQLTGKNVVMVQMTSDVIDWVDGLQPTTLMWETIGGMMVNFKVMAIGAPRIKADQTGNCGIAHYS